MNRYLTEFIGTFFLVLTIGLAVVPGADAVSATLAIGAVLTVLVYVGRHISGAHYNPAVTVAVWMRGRCDAKDIVPYWISQFAGAGAAAVVVGVLVGKGTPMVIEGVPKALGAEVLFTFALVFVILNVATAKRTAGNSYYGIAIGLIVMVGIFAVGDISGGVFNPAVAVGVGIMKVVDISRIWIHIAGNLLGAVAATLVFKLINPDDE